MGEVRGQEMSAGTPQAAALNIGQGVSGAGSRDPMSPLSPTPSLRYGDPRNCHSSPTSDPGPGLLCELKGSCQLPAAGLNLTFAVTSPGLPSRPRVALTVIRPLVALATRQQRVKKWHLGCHLEFSPSHGMGKPWAGPACRPECSAPTLPPLRSGDRIPNGGPCITGAKSQSP